MSSGVPLLSSSHEPTGSHTSPRPSESESLCRLVPARTAGFERPGQLSTASGTPSASASSSVAEQAPVWRTAVWQTPPPVQLALVVQEVAGALLQIWTTLTPTQSPSQASPSVSRSVFVWGVFEVRTQLSDRSTSESPSRFCVGLEQTKPWRRLVLHAATFPAMTGQFAATWQGARVGSEGVQLQVP